MSTVLWVALGCVGILAMRRFAFGYPTPEVGYRHLTRWEATFLESVAEATFPTGGAIPVSGVQADIPAYIDHWFDLLPGGQRRQVRLLIVVFEQATAIFPATGRGGFRRFSRLTPEQRVCVLRNWSESRFYVRRLLFTAMRAVVTFGYLANKGVLRHLNFAPLAFESPVCEADLLYPAVGRPLDSIVYTEADLTLPSTGIPLDTSGPLHPAYIESEV